MERAIKISIGLVIFVFIGAVGFFGYQWLQQVPGSGSDESVDLSGGTQNPTTFPGSGTTERQEDNDTPVQGTRIDIPAAGGTVSVNEDAFSQPEVPSAQGTDDQSSSSSGDEVTASTTTAPYSLAPTLNRIAGGWDDSFITYYNTENNAFYTYLLQEPLAEIRKTAEQETLARLGISQSNACRLWMFVFVSEEANQFFAGKNLGLSFCPGSTNLPGS